MPPYHWMTKTGLLLIGWHRTGTPNIVWDRTDLLLIGWHNIYRHGQSWLANTFKEMNYFEMNIDNNEIQTKTGASDPQQTYFIPLTHTSSHSQRCNQVLANPNQPLNHLLHFITTLFQLKQLPNFAPMTLFAHWTTVFPIVTAWVQMLETFVTNIKQFQGFGGA